MSVAKQEPADARLLQPPRYGLRGLFVATTFLCALFAVMAQLGALWASAFLLLVALIGLHVAGNVVGTRLRAVHAGIHDPPPLPRRPAGGATVPSGPAKAGTPVPLQQRRRCGWLVLVYTTVGAVAGGVLGGALVGLHYGASLTLAELFVSTIASGVIGGIGFFLSGNCVRIVHSSWRDAATGR